MAAQSKAVFRVQQVVDAHVAIVAEVKDGETYSGKVRETRDPKIALGGRDSFWSVAGERKDQRPFAARGDATPPPRLDLVSPLATRLLSDRVYGLVGTEGPIAAGKLEAIAFTSATRLAVGYSLPSDRAEEMLRSLLEGTLDVPLAGPVTAIEVRPGRWIVEDLERLLSGRYRLRGRSLREVRLSTIENEPERIGLAQGLTVFATPPRWSAPRAADLRPEPEILRSVERWMARSKAVLGPLRDGTAAELLRLLPQMAVTEDEAAELQAVAGLLAERQELVDVLPRLLDREPAFKARLADYEKAETARLGREIEDRIRRETEAGSSRLHLLRGDIEQAEAKLAALAHRESLLRLETDRHEDALRARIETAAAALREELSSEASSLRDELARLRDAIEALPPPPGEIPPPALVDEPPSPAEPTPSASEEDTYLAMEGLASSTGLSLAEVSAAVAMSTSLVPTFVGPSSTAAAIAFASALAGDAAAIVFCDPTKVSLADVLADERSGLAAAIDAAKATPDAFAAAALCSLSAGPCEYWLPNLVELRRVGRIPPNLALFASVETDGARVAVPGFVLRHLFPLNAASGARPDGTVFPGPWPYAQQAAPDRLRASLGTIVDRGLHGAAAKAAAEILARAPVGADPNEVAAVLGRTARWVAAVETGQDHEDKIFFKGTEG